MTFTSGDVVWLRGLAEEAKKAHASTDYYYEGMMDAPAAASFLDLAQRIEDELSRDRTVHIKFGYEGTV